MKINLPKEVNLIIEDLNKKGYEAYAVGGCVRDRVIGREPNDWDIATAALPEVIIDTFSHTVPTGLKHGTVTVIINKGNYEVTTFRIDGEYSDNRHPDEVIFTESLVEDLSRRDFTINAMAYNTIKGLVDPFHGQEDLKNKIVRTVGNADDRFNEDALRMIRAIRFSCQLGFSIDKDTFRSIRENYNLIKNVSIERIRDEFSKIMTSPHPSGGLENLRISGLLPHIMPEVMDMVGFDQKNPHHDKDVYIHTLEVIENTEPDLVTRLSALFHDIGKPSAFTVDEKGIGHFYGHEVKSTELCEKILKRMRFDNNTIKKVSLLVSNHMSRFENVRNVTVKKLITRVGEENLEALFDLQTADIKGSAPPFNFKSIDTLKEKIDEIIKEKHPISLKDLKITGSDLIALGYKPGKSLGEALNYILDKVLEDPELNEPSRLKELALKFLSL